MSDTHGTHVPDQPGSAPGPADGNGDEGDGAGHGSGQGDGGHGHDAHRGSQELGPIGWRMWGAGVVGVVAALLIAAGFVVATSFTFGA